MVRHRLTDEQWALISDIFPEPAQTGRPQRDPREMFDAIRWILRAGTPWRDLPDEFGPWETVYGRFNKWCDDGTFDSVLQRLQELGEFDKELWCIDGTIVRAHRCAAGGGKKKIQRNRLIMH